MLAIPLFDVNNAHFSNFYHRGVPGFTAWAKSSMNGLAIDPRLCLRRLYPLGLPLSDSQDEG